MISNAVVMIVRLFYVKQQMNFQIRVVRDALTYGILLFQTLILLICNSKVQYVLQLLLLVLIVLLYNKEVLAVLKKVKVCKI